MCPGCVKNHHQLLIHSFTANKSILSNNRQLDPDVSRHFHFGAQISAKNGYPLFFALENLKKQRPIYSRPCFGWDNILLCDVRHQKVDVRHNLDNFRM